MATRRVTLRQWHIGKEREKDSALEGRRNKERGMLAVEGGWGGGGGVQEADQGEVSVGYCTQRDSLAFSILAEEREAETIGSVFLNGRWTVSITS